MKRVLITGAGGQLGKRLTELCQAPFTVTALDSSDLDITNGRLVRQIYNEIRPEVVINAAAYTAVDRAEEEPAEAYLVNVSGVANLAQACLSTEARLIHISTDYVFGGDASKPFAPCDAPTPINVYGDTKRKGERELIRIAPHLSTIVRTSWLYGREGKNFLTTMLKILQTKSECGVVCDQIGAPTSTTSLAGFILRLASDDYGAGKLLHWSDAGVASWFDFAVAIRRLAVVHAPDTKWGAIRPIPTSEFPTAAKRPAFSLLNCLDTPGWRDSAQHWQESLAREFSREDLLLHVSKDTQPLKRK